LEAIRAVVELEIENHFGNILYSKSNGMKSVIEKVLSVAQTDSTVLLTGESGTGKTMFAKKIHELSKRKKNEFVSIHCGAIPDTLVESEFFGHEKGSFTGAIKKKFGKFELANGGTIFLDEIGTISRATQVRLLHVLQERFIQRVGGEVNIDLDIRIIAATNSDLKRRVIDKTFREDLYFRLNVFEIHIPPLRERIEDIEDLSLAILKRLDDVYGKGIRDTSTNVKKAFKHYSWPGNIREMENLIERAYILESSQILNSKHFPTSIFETRPFSKSRIGIFPSLNLSKARKNALDSFEVRYIRELLEKTEGNLQKASIESGVSVRQLQKLISKNKINRKNYVANSSI
jgi:transcriptional regulator with PAS, ATPase and Fis domain